MTRRNTNAMTSPLFAWTALSSKVGEMLWASSQVIAHRTLRMATAGVNPSARDRREFTRMGQEKVEAAGESLQAMSLQLMNMNAQAGAAALRQMMAAASVASSLAPSPTLAGSLARQRKLMKALSKPLAAPRNFSSSAARLAHHGLKPIHSRALANAKRLGKG